jgi:hypothetical protein
MRGNGRIFQRKGSAFLWCAYYLRGKEYRESTGETNHNSAELGGACSFRLWESKNT